MTVATDRPGGVAVPRIPPQCWTESFCLIGMSHFREREVATMP